MSNWYYCDILHNYIIVLIYNLYMTLLLYFLLDNLFARSRFGQNHLNLLVEKLGKKQSNSTKERAQIITLRNLKFFVHQMAKKTKVSETAVHNVIMK